MAPELDDGSCLLDTASPAPEAGSPPLWTLLVWSRG